MTRSKLAHIIAFVESDDNPNASHKDYLGNFSPNAQYQQSAAFVKAWGDGPAGVDALAHWLLKGRPRATLGDYYCVYNHGSLLPWSTYSARFPLQARNLFSKAHELGYSYTSALAPLLEMET